MKKPLIFFACIALIVMLSCKEDDERDCADYDMNFLYSLGFPTDSSFATVEFANASNNLPTDASIEWEVNGDIEFFRNGNSARFDNNGQFSILMSVTIDDVVCTVSREFEISGIR